LTRDTKHLQLRHISVACRKRKEKDGLKHYRSSRDPLPPDQPIEEIEKKGFIYYIR
jgi:hypothetical protein